MRRRLDLEMVRRQMASSRAEAVQAIRSGLVTVSGRPAINAAMLVRTDEPIAISGPARRFVSRAGEKLDAALDRFALDPAGLLALDAGASTGGFTDCLLARGSEHVVAVDVGYGQLDWTLRQDPRVTVLERTNVRDLTPADLPYAPDLVTADLSFISLRLVVPSLVACSAPQAGFVLLIKPQFEAGRDQVDGGVVRDPAVWRGALASVAEAAKVSGLAIRGVMASPLLGPAGNAEFLLHADRGDSPSALDVEASVEAAVDAAGELARHA